MHISEDEKEYLSTSKIRAILEKYCSFIPVEIFYFDGVENDKFISYNVDIVLDNNYTKFSVEEQ